MKREAATGLKPPKTWLESYKCWFLFTEPNKHLGTVEAAWRRAPFIIKLCEWVN